MDLGQLRRNAAAVQGALGSTKLIAVVKADAYGHGLARTAGALGRFGVKHFAVAYAAEALKVRASAPEAELILVLGVARGGDVARLLADRIMPVVVSMEQARELSAAAVAAGGRLGVHLKLDAGMGRLGFICPDEVGEATAVCALPGLKVEGVCAHFSMVEPERKPAMTRGQADKFLRALPVVEAAAGGRLFRHMSSSRAALLLPECDFDAARAGIVLYGYGAGEEERRFRTQPVMSWKSRVIQVKRAPAGFAVGYYASYQTATPTDLAVVSCGYTDGYQRHLGNRGEVLAGGRRCPVVGRVSMNWITVDLGPDSGVKPGDEVVLMGRQGGEEIWGDELARHCSTIAYEILTGVSRQIERRYVGE